MDVFGGQYSAHQNPPHWFFHVSPWRHCSGVVSFSSNECGFPEVCWQGGSRTPALPAWCQHENHCWSQWKLEQAGWLQDCQWVHNSVTEGEFPFQQLWPYKQQDIPSMVCIPNVDLCSEPSNSIITLSLLFCCTTFSGLLIRAGPVLLRCSRASETPFPTVNLNVLSSRSHTSWGITGYSSEETSLSAGPTWRVGFP